MTNTYAIYTGFYLYVLVFVYIIMYLILLVTHMSLYIFFSCHVTYILYFQPVYLYIFQIHANLHWYRDGSSYLRVSASVKKKVRTISCCLQPHTDTYALIWQFLFAWICLYVVCILCIFTCMCTKYLPLCGHSHGRFAFAMAARQRCCSCSCCTLAELPLHVRRAGRAYAGRMPF